MNKSRKYSAFLFFIMLIVSFAAAWVTLSGPAPSSTISILDFRQSESSLVLTFTAPPADVSYVQLDHVPITLQKPALMRLKKNARELTTNGTQSVMKIDKEQTRREYSIVVFVDDKFFELIRQSSVWLSNTFKFKRPGGYTILGRRSIDPVARPARKFLLEEFVGVPDRIEIEAVRKTKYDEINTAIGILNYLWSFNITTGPTNLARSAFIRYPFDKKVDLVRSGKFSVQCAGFRDLFLHASTVFPELRLRALDANNYSPQLGDLITYGHASAEIWISALRRWVIFDPWLGIIVLRDGVPVGAKELNAGIGTPEQFHLVPVTGPLRRSFPFSNTSKSYVFYPDKYSISEFTCAEFGCAPGYIEYFRTFSTAEVRSRNVPNRTDGP